MGQKHDPSYLQKKFYKVLPRAGLSPGFESLDNLGQYCHFKVFQIRASELSFHFLSTFFSDTLYCQCVKLNLFLTILYSFIVLFMCGMLVGRCTCLWRHEHDDRSSGALLLCVLRKCYRRSEKWNPRLFCYKQFIAFVRQDLTM